MKCVVEWTLLDFKSRMKKMFWSFYLGHAQVSCGANVQ
jgi:hypothetical protein